MVILAWRPSMVLRIWRDDRYAQRPWLPRQYVCHNPKASAPDLRRIITSQARYQDADHRHVPLISSCAPTPFSRWRSRVWRLPHTWVPIGTSKLSIGVRQLQHLFSIFLLSSFLSLIPPECSIITFSHDFPHNLYHFTSTSHAHICLAIYFVVSWYPVPSKCVVSCAADKASQV